MKLLLILTISFLSVSSFAQEGRRIKDWFLESVYYPYSGPITTPGKLATPFAWQIRQAMPEVSESLLLENLNSVMNKNRELRDLVKIAREQGVQVSLVGNSATDLLQYSHLLSRSQLGDKKPLKDRLDYHFSNIFPFSFSQHSPLEILLKGESSKVKALRSKIKERFSFANVQIIEKYNPGYSFDSYNRAVIHLEDLSFSKNLMRDVLSQELHFDLDQIPENVRLVVIHNYVFKAAIYSLQIPRSVGNQIRDYLNTLSIEGITLTKYQESVILKNYAHFNKRAYDQEYAHDLLKAIDPKEILSNLTDSKFKIHEADSFLQFKNQNFGFGKTAKELGIDIVTHQTKEQETIAAISSSPYGKANAIMSFAPKLFEFDAHNARRGTGFYTMKGYAPWHPDWGEQLVRFRVNPSARVGKDFFIYNNEIVFKTNVLEVVPKKTSAQPMDLFRRLFFTSWDFHIQNPNIEKPENLKHVETADVEWRFQIDLAGDPELRKEVDLYFMDVISKSPSIYYIPTVFLKAYLALPMTNESSVKAFSAFKKLYEESIKEESGKRFVYDMIITPALEKHESKTVSCKKYFG